MTAVTSDAARVLPGPRPRGDPVRSGLPRGFTIAVTIASALVFYALTTHGTFSPLYEQPQGGFSGRFFLAQANSLVHGHLYVSPTELPGECFLYRGRCFGYFGLTPSLLRVPFLPLLNDANRSFTSVYVTLALTLAVGSALGIVSRALANVPRTRLMTFLGIALAISLGPASVLDLITRPGVFEEAIAWSVAFGLLGVYCFLRWWSTPRWGWAALLVLSLVLSTNARPTTLPLGVALGAGIAVRSMLRRHEAGQAPQALLTAAIVAILPIATSLGVWWLKFDSLHPSLLLHQQIGGPAATPWWLAIRRIDHNHLEGVRFVPTALLAYLRPDAIALTSGFPFVNFRFGPPPAPGVHWLGVPPGSMYIEPFSTITDDMPLALAAVIGGLVYGVREARRRAVGLRTSLAEVLGSPWTYGILGTAASCGVMLSAGFITSRYVGDMFPLVAVALALAARFLAGPVARLSPCGAVAVVGVVTLLVAWSLVVNLGLDYQYWWHTAI